MNLNRIVQADGEINAIFSLRIRRKRKIGEGRKKKFVYRSSEKKTIVVVDRRRISSGLVNSQARHPSTKILRCFSPVLVYTSFEHVLFPRCVPLAPASPPVRCPLPTPSRGRAFNPSAAHFTHAPPSTLLSPFTARCIHADHVRAA